MSSIGLTNVAGGLVQSYWPYAFFRGIAGMCEQGLTQVSITLSMELVGVKYQGVVGSYNQGAFAVGTCLAGLISYVIRPRGWRMLHLATSCFIIPQFFIYWFVIPESPRWLISKDKWNYLAKVLKRGFKMNKTQLPPHLVMPTEKTMKPNVHETLTKHKLDEDLNDDSSSAKIDRKMSWGIMFTNRTILPRSCIMMLNWGFVALVYYGAEMSSTLLGGDIFVNFTLVAAVEVAANVAIIFFINNLGRKTTLMLGFFMSGVGCCTLGLLPTTKGGAALAMLLMGKFGASFAFTACYVFTNELFPTPIRNTAVGTCSMFSRLFSMTAPYISQYLPAVTSDQAPFLIFGVCGLIGCIISAFLPESLGHPLPDTVSEAAEMNKSSKSLFR